ncbi:MAG: chemotaxis protein CheW [Deltaproteobacteria bacterium]|nr:chemotaxis protein CheW [Deltaproteobacteria bacterium]
MNVFDLKRESSENIDRTDKAVILRERALNLAHKPCVAVQDSQAIEVLTFALGDEIYAVGSETVRELCSFKQITRVPCVPTFVLGIINLRGKIFSVIDLKRLFELPGTPFSEKSKVMILGFGDMEVGILADDVFGVQEIPVSEIQQDLPTLKGINEKYLYGITLERLTIINVESLLTDGSILVHETIEP